MRDVAAEGVELLLEVLGAAVEVLHGVEHVGDAQAGRGGGHQLRQAASAGGRARVRVEARLLLDQAGEQRGVEAVGLRRGGDLGGVRRARGQLGRAGRGRGGRGVAAVAAAAVAGVPPSRSRAAVEKLVLEGFGGCAAPGWRRGQHRLDLVDAAHDGFDAHAVRASSAVDGERELVQHVLDLRAHSASCSAFRRSLSLSIAWRSRAAAASSRAWPRPRRRGGTARSSARSAVLGALQEGLGGDEVDGGDAAAGDGCGSGRGRRRRRRRRRAAGPRLRRGCATRASVPPAPVLQRVRGSSGLARAGT